MAGITPKDIQYLHVHDCSHISSVCVAEVSGYLPQGQGLQYARDGRLRFDGDRPMTTHGGRHAFGHAWAASAAPTPMKPSSRCEGCPARSRSTPGRRWRSSTPMATP